MKKHIPLVAHLLLLALLALPTLSFAQAEPAAAVVAAQQDAGAPAAALAQAAAGTVGTTTQLIIPADPTDIASMANLMLSAVAHRQWGLLASLLVLCVVAVLRKAVPEQTQVGKWFRTKLGGILLNLAVSVAGAFAAAFLAGQSFSLPMVLGVVQVALSAAGGWAIGKNLLEAVQESKAAQVGAAAAAAAPTDTLNK